jgi:exodeoxyribonuclease VII large subunit
MKEPRLNIVEWTVSELSSALKRTVEDAYGYVRGARRGVGLQGSLAVRHVYFRLKDDKSVIEAVIWKREFAACECRRRKGSRWS